MDIDDLNLVFGGREICWVYRYLVHSGMLLMVSGPSERPVFHHLFPLHIFQIASDYILFPRCTKDSQR